MTRAERDRIKKGEYESYAHHQTTGHGVLRCGGTWQCLKCSAGNRQRKQNR